MKFFVDTADIAEIRELADTGLLDGVTTNPSLIKKSGRDFKETIKEICSITQGPVSAEVVATDYEGMVRQGEELAKIATNVTIKVPLTLAGLKACKYFTSKHIMVNVTLCFSAAQALLAAKAGATFISPFVGRLDDVGTDGLTLIQDILTIYNQYPEFETQVLVASVRNPMHIVESAKMGAHVMTAPASVIKSLVNHPLTDRGLDQFLKDWQATGQSL
ncbi:MAG: fructose-6-phosphate aldolase [Rickettsiales bacterium]